MARFEGAEMKILISLIVLSALILALVYLIKSGISSRFERMDKDGNKTVSPKKEKRSPNAWNQLSQGEDPTL